MLAISLFSCGGIGDLALSASGFKVLVANELHKDRAMVFKKNHPETSMIIGDIKENKKAILDEAKFLLEGRKLDVVFATPPCQGMSKNGRGKLLSLIRSGHRPKFDERNLLIVPTIDIFMESGAHTLIMENVPEMKDTIIPHPSKENEYINLIDYIKERTGSEFISSIQVVEFADYGVPQSRQRLISIFSKNKGIISAAKNNFPIIPLPTHSRSPSLFQKKWVTVRDSISHLPALDSKSLRLSQHKKIPFHRVPLLDSDKYLWVKHAKPEKSAFDNQCINEKCLCQENPTHKSVKNKEGINESSRDTPIFCIKCGSLLPRPWVKEKGGYRLMKGYTSAYKRMAWDLPSSTLTRNLSYACSDNKLHPDQNRVLSLHEAMILHTLNEYQFIWERADGKEVSDKLIRELIGESIPPKGLEKIFTHIATLISRR